MLFSLLYTQSIAQPSSFPILLSMGKVQKNVRFAVEHLISLRHLDPLALTLEETGAPAGAPTPWGSFARLLCARNRRINGENGPFGADGLESYRRSQGRTRE